MAYIVNPTPTDLSGESHLCSYLRESIWLNTDGPERYLLPKPYEYADIAVEERDPRTLFPTATYVLKSHLAMLLVLEKLLKQYGLDIFDIRGMVCLGDENQIICPPIIEVWNQIPHEFDGREVIVDGLHRNYLARKRGRKITCVVISGRISSDLPVMPLTWNYVREQDTVPKDKRVYVRGIPTPWKHYELYRVSFPGSTGPRAIAT